MRPRLRNADSGQQTVPAEIRLEQRRRQVAGLALLAIAILIFSLWRAGLAAVFPTGWWRLW
ncbi:MAG TPA: hypothetical protein VM554_10525 [Acidisarcina sp.]|nr:hypothetical protein [Acidisarcina sp.]